MRDLGFAPLKRAILGLDHIADLMHRALSADVRPSHQPYSIERTTAAAHRVRHVDLLRETPETLKPRRIEIANTMPKAAPVLEAQAKDAMH